MPAYAEEMPAPEILDPNKGGNTVFDYVERNQPNFIQKNIFEKNGVWQCLKSGLYLVNKIAPHAKLFDCMLMADLAEDGSKKPSYLDLSPIEVTALWEHKATILGYLRQRLPDNFVYCGENYSDQADISLRSRAQSIQNHHPHISVQAFLDAEGRIIDNRKACPRTATLDANDRWMGPLLEKSEIDWSPFNLQILRSIPHGDNAGKLASTGLPNLRFEVMGGLEALTDPRMHTDYAAIIHAYTAVHTYITKGTIDHEITSSFSPQQTEFLFQNPNFLQKIQEMCDRIESRAMYKNIINPDSAQNVTDFNPMRTAKLNQSYSMGVYFIGDRLFVSFAPKVYSDSGYMESLGIQLQRETSSDEVIQDLLETMRGELDLVVNELNKATEETSVIQAAE